MKTSRFLKITLCAVALCLIFASVSAPSASYAASSLSPAIDMLSQNTVFVKNALKNSEVTFSASEFEKALGASRISSITLLSLPEESDGRLLLGKVPVLENQIISRKKVGKMVFIPWGEGVSESEFVFGCISSGYPRVVKCSLKFTETLNFAPSVSSYSISVYGGVERASYLRGDDPDGDKAIFEIVSRPTKGTLRLKSENSGEFVYISDGESSGKDSFSYTVRDCYGNISEVVNVDINIKKAPDILYTDISPSFEHTALFLAEKGIFRGKSVGKYSYFEPESSVSYSEFAIMAMSASGVKFDSADGALSVFESLTETAAPENGEALTVSAACEMISELFDKEAEASSIGGEVLTREVAAELIFDMIG